jgi:transcriptional regulator with XRE-family HTH domain/uncharacterized membrane protein
MIGDYFNTLPIHPQPEPMETFTSYLTRLAEANKIQAIYQLQPFFFPQRSHGVIRELADHPMSSFGELPALAACSESRLLETTFYYLAQRFNRPTGPQATGQFLSGTIARHFRYCPLCLAGETPYYSLAWRFLMLSGCPHHACRFLNQCPHCRHNLPFLTTALKIGVCPSCNGRLSAGVIEALTEAERQQAQRHYHDLTFLLSAQTDNTLSIAPGPRLAYWRRRKGLTVDAVAQQTGKTSRLIKSLEHYKLERNAKLQNYLDYTDYLGLSFAKLFATELSPKEERVASFPFPKEGQSYEGQLVERVKECVATLKAEGSLLTQQAISDRVGMSITGLFRYPQVKALLIQLNHERCQQLCELSKQREQKLTDEVRQAIIVLQDRGEPITRKAIGELLGRKHDGFNRYPTAWAILREATRQQRELDVQKTVDKVEAAIIELQESNQPITKTAVARLAGLTTARLNCHPQIRSSIKKHISPRPYLQEEKINELIREAIYTLRSQGKKLTMTSISQYSRIGADRLRNCSQAEWLYGECEKDRQVRQAQYKVNLLEKVQQAINNLQAENKLVSQYAICRLTGLPSSVFSKYPEISEQVAVARQATLKKQKEQRLQNLLERIEQALVDIKVKNIPLTARSIHNQIGTKGSALRIYPEAEFRIRQAVKEYREKNRQQQRNQREQSLVEEVEIAIDRLQKQGKPVTQKAICQIVGVTRPTLWRYPRIQEILEKIMQKGVARVT